MSYASRSFASKFLRSLLIVGAALMASRAAADEALRWKLAAGDVLDYQTRQDMNVNVDAGAGAQMAMTAGQTLSATWTVKSVAENGDATIEQKIDRIQTKRTAPDGQGFEYDTDSEEPAAGIAAMIAPMLEAKTSGPLTFTMSPRGEVRDVKLSDELAEAVKGSPGGSENAVEDFKSQVSQLAFQLPENPLKTGETWTTKNVINSAGGTAESIEMTFTYDGTRDADGTTYAVIKPSLKLDLGQSPAVQMKVKDQKTDGEVLFDVQAGELHSLSINRKLTIDIAAMGQTMPGMMDQNIEIKVTPPKAADAKVKN